LLPKNNPDSKNRPISVCSVEIGGKSVQISHKIKKIFLIPNGEKHPTTLKFDVFEYDQSASQFFEYFWGRHPVYENIEIQHIMEEVNILSSTKDQIEKGRLSLLENNVKEKKTVVFGLGRFFEAVKISLSQMALVGREIITRDLIFKYLFFVLRMNKTEVERQCSLMKNIDQSFKRLFSNMIFLLGIMDRLGIQEIIIVDVGSGLFYYPLNPEHSLGQINLWNDLSKSPKSLTTITQENDTRNSPKSLTTITQENDTKSKL